MEKSVKTDVIDVVLEIGNNIEFCRVDGTDDSVSVSTTEHRIVITMAVQSSTETYSARLKTNLEKVRQIN
jgi:hypothetical protein